MGLPSHYSICPSQLKYQMKKKLIKASVLYEQFEAVYHTQHFVQYATLCLFSLYTEQSIKYFG